VETPETVNAWANEVFPNRTPASAFLKMFEEIGEYVRNPRDGGELADIIIMLWDLGVMHGINIQSAIDAKMIVNRRRTWRVNLETGVAQHVDK
jgi:hypothetical protein